MIKAVHDGPCLDCWLVTALQERAAAEELLNCSMSQCLRWCVVTLSLPPRSLHWFRVPPMRLLLVYLVN